MPAQSVMDASLTNAEIGIQVPEDLTNNIVDDLPNNGDKPCHCVESVVNGYLKIWDKLNKLETMLHEKSQQATELPAPKEPMFGGPPTGAIAPKIAIVGAIAMSIGFYFV